jgi:hypothetical protein
MSLSAWLNYKAYTHMRNADTYKRQEKITKLLQGHSEEELILEQIIEKRVNISYTLGLILGVISGLGMGFFLSILLIIFS